MADSSPTLTKRIANILLIGTLVLIPASTSQWSVDDNPLTSEPSDVHTPKEITALSTNPIQSLPPLFSTLSVRPPLDVPYDRSVFGDWIDADGDGCDTRAEVLRLQSLRHTHDEGSCIPVGRWFSLYDNITTDDSTDLEVDHLVPLKEAWVSGAAKWTRQRLHDYFNDMSVDSALIAVTRSSNRAKGARDPADWLPENREAHCRYINSWIAVKHRWQLHIDDAELRALRAISNRCEIG